tara:strand:- start:80 stop:571 length:492 start_codon:yes stop_codon:yes gene_type:complete
MVDGIVKIHGKEYLTVAKRVSNFRSNEKYQNYSLETEVVELDDQKVVMKAFISNENGRVIATGHAEEKRQSSMINKTSALENCETSAIGRALASLGFGGTEFASANEVENAIAQQQETNTNEIENQLNKAKKISEKKEVTKNNNIPSEWLKHVQDKPAIKGGK